MGFYLTAFFELSTERPPSLGGIMPIPWSKIRDYADRVNLQGLDYEAFLSIMRIMDAKVVGDGKSKAVQQKHPEAGSTPGSGSGAARSPDGIGH